MTHNTLSQKDLPSSDGGGTGRYVTPRQSNHEVYTLPECLANFPPMPLYLAVAHFGLLSGRPLSREDISQAFHIDRRRALEVMRYLVNNAPRVTCKCLSLMKGRGYCLHIIDIASPEQGTGEPPSCSARPRGSAAKRERAQQQMRQWFLQRPNP
ncbi:CaiF/GrlA family transcriptional regulator [Serratia marcescens]|uniref:CaiF/GrlA family transcriptional regulator n=1 Tax=Serratia marcescens TaxID=615 RepID=UPI0021B554BD|nr:CaiF/GrlA family transcriptional regulator [Serratia marcescens]